MSRFATTPAFQTPLDRDGKEKCLFYLKNNMKGTDFPRNLFFTDLTPWEVVKKTQTFWKLPEASRCAKKTTFQSPSKGGRFFFFFFFFFFFVICMNRQET